MHKLNQLLGVAALALTTCQSEQDSAQEANVDLENELAIASLTPAVETVLLARLSEAPSIPERDLALEGGQLHLQPYAEIASFATPQQYWGFILKHLQSTEEVAALTDHQKNNFLTFHQSSGLPSPSPEILKNGESDCSGFAELTCAAVQQLNLPSRVIAIKGDSINHAFCLYEEGEANWVIDHASFAHDQNGPETQEAYFQRLQEAGAMEGGVAFSEQSIDEEGRIKLVSLDADLQDPKDKMMLILPHESFSSPFKVLPPDWETYQKVTVCYQPVGDDCTQKIIFEEGRIAQVQID